MGDLNRVAQGITGTFTVQIRDRNGDPFDAAHGSTYTGGVALAGTVRIGTNFPALFTLAPAWVDATAGTIAVAILGTQTAGLDVGKYLVQVKLADGSADLYEGTLEVTYSPGSAAALTTYGSYQKMLSMAPGVAKFVRDTDLAGFAQQQHDARKWLEDVIHRHDRGPSGLSSDFTLGVIFGAIGPTRSTAVAYRDGRRSTELAAALAAGRLVVTDQVVEAVTAYAVALLYDRQATSVAEGDGFARTARKFFARAADVAETITAEIDTDGDGVTDYVIRLGATDTLEG